jgi:hypothetical protein
MRLWDAQTGQLIETINTESSNGVYKCEFSPDGSTLVADNWVDFISVYDLDRRQMRGYLACQRQRTSRFSADGRTLLSAGHRDSILIAWDPQTGIEYGRIPNLGNLHCLAMHPVRPYAVCAGNLRTLYLVELMGFPRAPLIVTAREGGGDGGGGELTVTCPACRRSHVLNPSQLGALFVCPTPICSAHLRVNPFAIHLLQFDPSHPTLATERSAGATAAERPAPRRGRWPFHRRR